MFLCESAEFFASTIVMFFRTHAEETVFAVVAFVSDRKWAELAREKHPNGFESVKLPIEKMRVNVSMIIFSEIIFSVSPPCGSEQPQQLTCWYAATRDIELTTE